jgi:ABC-type multidrug transport system fused ATPase/permease subunit
MKGGEGKIEWWGKRLILSLFLPLIGSFIWTYSADLAHREEAQTRAERYETAAQERITQVCPHRETRAFVAGCIEETISTRREDQRRESEVQAQEEIATWASYSALLQIIGLSVSIVGILVLLRTIRQGQEQLAHAQQTADAELRPWLQVEIEPGSFSVTKDFLTASFTATITNVGRTPAQRVRLGRALILEERDAIQRCAELFALPPIILSYGEHPRALLPKGVARISKRARLRVEQAQLSVDQGSLELRRIPNPIIFVVVYYFCPGHAEPSKTALSFRLNRTVTVLSPPGGPPRKAPGIFRLSEEWISAAHISAEEYSFCEAT